MGVAVVHAHKQGSARRATILAAVAPGEREGWSNEQLEEKAARAARIKAARGEVFLPELLKKAGYVTGQFGKLEWGFTT